MAHRDREATGGKHGQSNDSAARNRLQHFFKIMRPTTIQDKKLMIPPMFSRKRGDELSDVATLNVPADGRAWKVGVTRGDGDILFDDAWAEFVEYYSIKPGYLLVFKCKGMSCFNVHIFDSTACEIQYPFTGIEQTNNKQCLSEYGDDSGDDTSSEILGCNPSSSEGVTRHCEAPPLKRCLNSIPGNNKCRKNFFSSTSQDLERQGMFHSAEDKNRKDLFEENKQKGRQNAVKQYPWTYTKCYSRENYRATIQAALMFKPSHPSYMLVLKLYHFDKNLAYLPGGFAAKYLTKVDSLIKFQVSDGREWSLGVKRQSKDRIYIYQGFREFIRDNNLKEGDVCVLEKVMEENDVLKATIFCSECAQAGLQIDDPNQMPSSVRVKETNRSLDEH